MFITVMYNVFQPTSGSDAAAAAEASLDKVESIENKSAISGLMQAIATSESGRGHISAGVEDDRERLIFHIALGESGFASLGISVTKVFRNRKDGGVFIKSVRIGGMAAKVHEPFLYLLEYL